MSRSQMPKGAALWRAHPGAAGPGRPNVHVMDLDRPHYHAPGTGQISREVARYIIARGPVGCFPRERKGGRPAAEPDRFAVIYGTTQSDIAVQNTKRWAQADFSSD